MQAQSPFAERSGQQHLPFEEACRLGCSTHRQTTRRRRTRRPSSSRIPNVASEYLGSANSFHDHRFGVVHFFRFWLWLTTGMVTKAWVAIHRKHHARCESAEDPHSPQILGIKTVL